MTSLATPKSVQRLIDEFSRLPGVGPKTASRLTYFLLRGDGQQPRDLAQALLELKERTRLCSTCFNITESDPCPVCADAARQVNLLCVVEEPLDVLAIERTNFKGRYHVLHGVLSPVEGVGPEDLKIKELVVGTGALAGRESRVVVNLRIFLHRGQEVTVDPCNPRTVIDLGKRECIAGVRYGIVGMWVGGRRELVISPYLAYGDTGVPGLIPPKAVLRCEVELLEVQPGV